MEKCRWETKNGKCALIIGIQSLGQFMKKENRTNMKAIDIFKIDIDKVPECRYRKHQKYNDCVEYEPFLVKV